MAQHLVLRDDELARAAEMFLAAAGELDDRRGVTAAASFRTVTGIGESIRQFLEALSVAQAALTDAAHAASKEVAAVMTDSSVVDAALADTASEFALSGAPPLRRGGAR